MKKIFLLLVLALTATFANPNGIYVDVELLSGTRQRAQLMGIENDTVSLGGYIQNKFTIVKIAKKQFKRIVDEKGNDLLAVSSSSFTPVSSATSSSSAEKIVESSSSETPVKADTVSADTTQSKDSVPEPKPTQQPIKSILIAYGAEGVEQSIADQLTALTARLLMESGEKPQIIRKSDVKNCNDNICIQTELASYGYKSIYFGEIVPNIKTDSLTLNLTHAFYEDSLPMLHRASVNVSRIAPLSDAVTNNKLSNQLLDAQGKETIKSKKNRTYIHIETDPDGATISRSEKDAICKSPCTFITADTAKFTVYAYWNVDRHLWGASTNITPLPGDTVHVSLKLKRVTPEIRILTFPEGASIYKACPLHVRRPVSSRALMQSIL